VKKMLFILLFCIAPLSLLANNTAVETDIFQRSINFIIFIAILYYLLAKRIKIFFRDRTNSIQGELDKAQQILQESALKAEEATIKLENAKKLANEIIEMANVDVKSIKNSIKKTLEHDIDHLVKSFDNKKDLEIKKAKKEVVTEVLDELLSADSIAISQDELANIITKKVA